MIFVATKNERTKKLCLNYGWKLDSCRTAFRFWWGNQANLGITAFIDLPFVSFRYFLRVTMGRRLTDLTKELDLGKFEVCFCQLKGGRLRTAASS